MDLAIVLILFTFNTRYDYVIPILIHRMKDANLYFTRITKNVKNCRHSFEDNTIITQTSYVKRFIFKGLLRNLVLSKGRIIE